MTEWDAAAYQRLSDPQFEWGLRVLDRLALRGDERVIDAGCGSGRLLEVLVARLPRGHAVAVDASANMIAEARARLAERADRVTFVCADLASFVAEPPADAIFSAATFHWIHDHDALFACLFASLRPGGRVVAQCGGGSNLERFHAHAAAVAAEPRFRDGFRDFREPWHFASPAATATRLAAAGFIGVRCELKDAPTPFADAATFREFVQKIVLRHHLAALPAPLRDPYLDDVVARAAADAAPLTLDYQRLNLTATRPG